MASVYKEGKTWTVAWINSTGKRSYARGLPSRKLAGMIAESREFGRHAAKHGVITTEQERAAAEEEREISVHLGEYIGWLKGKKRSAQYIRETKELIERVFKAASVKRLSHLDRYRIVTACDALMSEDPPLSRRTRNKALQACKSFIAWLAQHDRILSNVLYREPKLNEEEDRRRVRKTMTEAQTLKLIDVTPGQIERGGMTGMDRMIRYALGIGTGFRQGTLFSLRPPDFHLDAEQPYITVIATNIKSRKTIDHPISHELADMLRPWLVGKAPTKPVFRKMKWSDPMKAYRQDLKAAGIEYNEEGSIEFCDQHAQRNAFITSVIRAAGLKVAQDLAHHSTPALTSKYGRLEFSDYAKGLAALPKMKSAKPDEKRKQAQMVDRRV